MSLYAGMTVNERLVRCRHSGAMPSIEPQGCNCTPWNLEIPRCAIAHLKSGAPSRNDIDLGETLRRQRLLQIRNQIFLVLDADRQPDHVGGSP
jgi:hypothetical protein